MQCPATPKNPATNTVYFINPATNKKVKFKTTELPVGNSFKQILVLDYEPTDVVLLVRALRYTGDPGREYFISFNMSTFRQTGWATSN